MGGLLGLGLGGRGARGRRAARASPGHRLHPIFDDCILGEPTLDARWVYSTDACERVLRAHGWEPEEARKRVARMATVVSEGWPDFL